MFPCGGTARAAYCHPVGGPGKGVGCGKGFVSASHPRYIIRVIDFTWCFAGGITAEDLSHGGCRFHGAGASPHRWRRSGDPSGHAAGGVCGVAGIAGFYRSSTCRDDRLDHWTHGRAGLSKPRTIKRLDKLWQRIDRLKEKSHDIELIPDAKEEKAVELRYTRKASRPEDRHLEICQVLTIDTQPGGVHKYIH